MAGILYLCATPIGNLEDITLRALRILREVDVIAAEDTRHTRKLLTHFEIPTPTTSYHEHNKTFKGPMLIEQMLDGKSIALVTDAGTPGISDPGEDLVRLAHESGITVTAAPGSAAVIMGLIISGLSTRRFVFEAFLPMDKKERKQVLKELEKETRTIVLYEAPHRLKETLESLYQHMGNRHIAITRELTKKHEEVRSMMLEEAVQYYKEHEPRGEFVLVIQGVSREILKEEEIATWEEMHIEEHMNIYLKQGMAEKEAMKQVAKDRGVSKREIYAYLYKKDK